MTDPASRSTAWARRPDTPLRSFLRTESGSAAVLLGATVAALVWANVAATSYAAFWHAQLSVRVGDATLGMSARDWVNAGLMAFFFFVVGLEARREFDMGELRERQRLALPLAAGIGGMAVPILIYLAFNAGRTSAHGWGIAMSTDTAFALGMLVLVGPRFPDRLRSFMLTVVVVDDFVALVVIATVYTEHLRWLPLAVAAVLFGVVLVVRALHVRAGLVYAVLGLAIWVAVLKSGIDPVVVGLAMGLLTYAYAARRGDLDRASELFRSFREQPTPELAREARVGLESAISLNDRLQELYHPWTSYLIVPLFALANAGIALGGGFLAGAVHSPITWGIVLGYVVGKPVGVLVVSWLVSRLARGRLRPPVGWVAVAGGGAIAGIGFTVALLIATLAFDGVSLERAKLGVLAAAALASAFTWVVFRATNLLPSPLRVRALLGTAETLVDLAVAVDEDRDHIRGPEGAHVTLVEYGDFECPYCGQAEPVVRELLSDFGDLRYVWRHLPLHDVHPRAQMAAEAAEAAAQQSAFWPMHDVLMEHQGALAVRDLIGYATGLGLDRDVFVEALKAHAGAARVAEDVDGADLSGVAGTPTFFVNGRRHHGAYDVDGLTGAVKLARAQAAQRGSAGLARGPDSQVV
ncbi:MAG: Na+/H+ antiporter NhaA [bacterium]